MKPKTRVRALLIFTIMMFGILQLFQLGMAIESKADPIILHSFTGHIRTIQQGGAGFSFDGSVVVGTSVTSSFGYDISSTITSPFDAFRVDYFPDANFVFIADIGNYAFTSGYRIRVADDLPQNQNLPIDSFTLEKNGAATFTNGTDTVSDLLWSLNLFDPNGTAFSSTDLPLALPSLAAFRDEFINLQVPRNSPQTPDTSTLVIALDSISSQDVSPIPEPSNPIPEPSTLLLLGSALAELVLFRRRRKLSRDDLL